MIRKIAWLLLAVVLLSCSTQKNTEKKELNTVTDTELKTKGNLRNESNLQSRGNSKIDSAMLAQINYLFRKVVDLETETIRFDTSKPVDASGKPPVQEIIRHRSREDSEVDYKSITEKLTHVISEVEMLNNQLITYKTELDSLSRVKQSDKVTTKTTSKTNTLKFILVGIVIGILITGIVWLIRRYK